MAQEPEIERIYPLSPMQKGFLFHLLYDKSLDMYFEQLEYDVIGKIDVLLIERCLNILIKKYDILRTVFIYQKIDEPQQVVLKERHTQVYFEDIKNKGKGEQSRVLKNFLHKDRTKGFDLSKDTLIRISVFQLQENYYKVIWSFHHIILDGWSLGILIQEFLKFYNELSCGIYLKQENNSFTEADYSTYIQWLTKQNKDRAIDYWNQYLEDYDQQATLPKFDRLSNNREYKIGEETYYIDISVINELNSIAQKYQVTLNTIFQAAWGILLQRYNNIDDVVFGAVVSGRPPELPGIEKMVGLFINTIPVRVKCSNTTSFLKLITQVQQSMLLSNQYNFISLAEIYSSLSSKQNIIDNILVFENYPVEKAIETSNQELNRNFQITNIKIYEKLNYDINIIVIPGKVFKIKFSYNVSSYKKEFVKQVQNHLKNILKTIIKSPDILVPKIDILSNEEKKQIIHDYNDTEYAYPEDKTIHELFEERVEKNPNKIAVVYEGLKLTYIELDKKANQLAWMLRNRGVKPGSIVGIMIERSIDFIIGIFGILKAGGAFVPIDPLLPSKRVEFILNNCRTGILITQQHNSNNITIPIDIIDLNLDDLTMENELNDIKTNKSSDLLYLIYTSGTTGQPKGVLLEHRNLLNLIYFEYEKTNIDFTKKVLQFASLSFDVCYQEIFSTLLAGGSLYIINDYKKKDVNELFRMINNEQINTVFLPPVYLKVISKEKKLLHEFPATINHIITAGEQLVLTSQLRNFLKSHQIFLHNHYGPAETHVVTTFTMNPGDKLVELPPIGKPIMNTKIYIVDNHEMIQVVGAVGEICISGSSVGRGYLYMPELTAEKFISNPFDPGKRMYRTGDLGRWLPDGNIEFIGRKDHQVKIKGYRIELREVESNILDYPSVKEVVVQVKTDTNNNKYLSAYIVSDDESIIPGLKEFLGERLPSYMIPTFYQLIDEIPLIKNGKVDYQSLEKYQPVNSGTSLVPPRDEKERIVANIWREVLGVPDIGIDDNFLELGGDSIKAIQIAARVQKYKMAIEVRDLLQRGSIREISKFIRVLNREVNQGLVTGEIQLTPIQKWFFERDFKEKYHWNQAVVLYRKDGFDEEIVKKVMGRIVEHHDALRMVFKISGGRIIQYNRPIEGELFSLKVVELTNVPLDWEKINSEVNIIQKSIDLTNGPLVKLGLFKTNAGDHLLIVIHHLIIDAVSMRIILEDFDAGYHQSTKNQEIKFQYKTDSFMEWSKSLYEYSNSKNLLGELDYWKRLEQNNIELLPKDHMILEDVNIDNRILTLLLSKDDTENLLKRVNQAYNTEINDILLTALGLSLKEWTHENKFLISMEGHGREKLDKNLDITRTIGWFTAIYPVLLDVTFSEDLTYIIKSIKENLRHIPNKGVGYGIIKYLTKDNEKLFEFNLKPEIGFNFLGDFDKSFNTKIFTKSNISQGPTSNPNAERLYVLNFTGYILSGKLGFTVNYNKKVFNESTIIKFIQEYQNNIEKIINHCITKKTKELTPTDTGDKELTIEELDNISAYISGL